MAVPWRTILKALPAVVGTAEMAWGRLSSKPKEPPVNPAADLHTQIEALAKRVQELEAAEAEQAKVLAELAEQVEAIARRAARGAWVAWAGLVIAVAAVVVALVR